MDAPAATAGLIEFLRTLDVSDEEIARAQAEGPQALQLLASERLLIGGAPKYTSPETANLAGVPLELADRFWRAMGFPDVPDDQRVFTDADVKMLGAAGAMIAHGISEPEVALQLTRVMGLSLARVAESQVDAFREALEPPLRAAGASDEEIATATLQTSRELLPTLEDFLLYIWRRHLAAAVRRNVIMKYSADVPTITLTVGFVDMVGFTALAQELSDRELGRIVERFEGLAYDTVASFGGRVVKWIGDEVMFVAENARTAAEIALRLAEEHARADDLPDVSVGLAAGPVLSREGDYLGPTVNLAARIVSVARPGTVVVSETVRDELEAEDSEDFVWRPLRPRMLKGIGRVRLWKLVRAVPGGPRPKKKSEGDDEEEYDDDDPPERVVRTRERAEDILDGARDVLDQVGPPLERIEEVVERIKERRRSARSRRPERS
jgi:adenylate cyclase